ncbi:major facilitator family transporter [[Clostridium] sordellii]|uniref:MDR-type permease n=1 Tax=Paraclostridium sordellii TaxID=1505 RepID=A0ABM9RL68_PARSO|nr:MFS transporter [Paeniclostridium sordellii]CEJ72728.1 MDR-type permease [[Clostridium] sordellii] [Paeniclostridium sordellii]CEN68281.1 major facilitator family transporter [[Clostridium] sordellii] [Paeniclostridium sordellii]CEN71548.1 major facilitator family transporter [[Clostridium] sordellii] [Paeniclostridium sordellii]CEO21701.1 major facilitator family transporter [[Clostridium] sordellii] [Paeniclostridium sordellii]CEP76859.1 major facilitator family transporter [[Clostridium]
MSEVQKKNGTGIAMLVFLLGIFMGAMDSGIVSPARDVIANGLGITESASVWMITIYTLAYAVSMPITGKLADTYGRKKVYMICVILFATGSLLCGVSDIVGSYQFLLTSRVIQAIGGGGIMPIATAYIGASFPEEKRGSALGMVGGVYGIATVLGPTLGSFVLSMTGNSRWGFLFLINVPISIIIIIAAFKLKENKKESKVKKMDIWGSVVLSVMVASIMYGLTNLKFYDFANSIQSMDVWPYLIIFIAFIPLFISTEKRAEDPVLNLNFFTNKQTALTLFLSFIVGCGLMSTVFLPQFSENVLRIKRGSGGYVVTLFAVFTGIAAPLGGKFIDKFGVKKLLLLGFGVNIIGVLYQALVTANHPNFTNLTIGLVFMGAGMGFTMGTPINYLMMSLVKPEEISMGQSTVSLLRSIGVAVSPNLLINFVSDAGRKVPGAIEKVMPQIPGGALGSGHMSSQMMEKFQNADVTNIFNTVKSFVESMFNGLQHTMGANPNMHFDILKNNYFVSLDKAKPAIENAYQYTMNQGYAHLFIGTAVIAILGLIASLFIKNHKKA